MTGPDTIHVTGQLELAAEDAPCLLCAAPTGRWADLCDACAAAFHFLAVGLGLLQGEQP